MADIGRLLQDRAVFKNSNDFEILGIDFLIDDQEKAWVLEINQHPGWHSSHPDTRAFCLNALESLFGSAN